MFIRFVVPFRHPDSHRLTGIFYAACGLRDRRPLSEAEEQWCDDILGWFNHYLPIPNLHSRWRKREACGKAICWFKDDATRYIRKIRELAVILERHGLWTEMLRTKKPGYVVYEDSYQVAAVPFRDTRA
jgi:hypothetical protein